MNSSIDEVYDIMDVGAFSFTGSFEEQLDEVLTRVRLTRDEVIELNSLLDDLQRVFSHNWRGSHVHPFGSIVSGLGIKTSDIDCYVEVPSNFLYGNPVKLARGLLCRTNSNKYVDMICITTAKVPLLKFVHAPTGIQCDLNFSCPLGVYNSKLIAFLLNSDSRALRLAILIKYWSKFYKLAGTNLLANYSVTMMVIFYLQVKCILPSVEKLQENISSYIVDSWNTAFNGEFTFECSNNESLYELIGDFFNYYSKFNYAEDVISPYIGFPIKKNALENVNSLPSYALYKYNLSHSHCEPIKLASCMCIQDPFEHSRNCSAAVFPNLFQRIKQFMEISSKHFQENSREQYLRALFSICIPSLKTLKKKRKKANKNNNNTQNVQKPMTQKKKYKKLRKQRAKDMLMQYQKDCLRDKL